MPRPAPYETAADAIATRRRLDDIDARHRQITTARLAVTPPDGVDVCACGLCGVGAVTVDGAATVTRTETETETVCSECSGRGQVQPGPPGVRGINPMRCSGCAGGQAPPQITKRIETAYLVEVEHRDLAPDALAALVWSTLRIEPYGALGVAGGRTVRLALCPTCAAAHAEVGSFGPVVAERLLTQSGRWRLPMGATLPSLRQVSFAAQVLLARRRGRPEPEPNATAWAHLDGARLAVADGLAERVIEPDTGYVRQVHAADGA